MDALLGVALFWAIVIIAMTLFGIACLRYGVYTSGHNENHHTLEV